MFIILKNTKEIFFKAILCVINVLKITSEAQNTLVAH